jgi:hypothetical protein
LGRSPRWASRRVTTARSRISARSVNRPGQRGHTSVEPESARHQLGPRAVRSARRGAAFPPDRSSWLGSKAAAAGTIFRRRAARGPARHDRARDSRAGGAPAPPSRCSTSVGWKIRVNIPSITQQWKWTALTGVIVFTVPLHFASPRRCAASRWLSHDRQFVSIGRI